jgi:hypothetical protein
MSNLRIAWERHRRGVSRTVSSEGRSIAIPGSPSDCKRLQSCQPDRLLPVTQLRSGVRRPNGRTGKELHPEASWPAAGEGTGFRPEGRGFGPGGGGLRAATERRSSGNAVTSDGDARALSPRGCGWCRNNAAARPGCGWALATGAAESSRETQGSYQPGTLRSDAAAIWKYRHSASSYSGSSASSSSAVRMCRSHASCAAIPIAKRA